MKKLAITAILLFALFPLLAENFNVDYYAVKIVVDKARSMDIKETLTLDYTVPSHGFYRDIQYSFQGGVKADVDIIWTSEPVQEERDGTYLSLRFGDPDKLISGGPHAYGVQYEFSLGADSYDDYDEIYYNIVSPDAWDTDISRLIFSLTLPYPVDPDRVWITAGPYGSGLELPFTISDDGCTISGRYSSLPKGYGVTLRVEMEDGYFDEAVRPFNWVKLGFYLSIGLSAIMVLVALIVWYLKGKDGELIYPVRFDPPEGMTPMDVGYVYNGELDESAVSAMLIYWADKGIITITDNGNDDFVFTKLMELPDSAKPAELQLFSAFFAASSSVDAKVLRVSGFSSKLASVKKTEEESFSGEKSLASPSSMKLRKLMMNLGMIPVLLHSLLSTLVEPGFATIFVLVPFFMAFMMLRSFATVAEKKMRSGGFRFSIITAPLLFMVFIWFFVTSALTSFGVGYRLVALDTGVFLVALFVYMHFSAAIARRSEYADKLLSEVLGYREFIEKVEKDRIERLSKEDPQFFYRVLSYAMALGVEDKWARAFSGIYVEPAAWYYGRDLSDIYVLSSFSRRWRHVYASSIAPRRNGGGGARTFRGSSGFSGGGFSGGGGRSW